MRCSGAATGPRIRWSTKHESYHPRETPPSRVDSGKISHMFDAAWKPFSASETAGQDNSVTEVALPGGHDQVDRTAVEPQIDPTSREAEQGVNEIAETQPALTQTLDDNFDQNLSSLECAPSDHVPPSPMKILPFTVFQQYPEEISAAELGYLSTDSPESNAAYPEGLSPHSVSSTSSTPSTSWTFNQTPIHDGCNPLTASPVDMQSELVGIYFKVVCPIFSTFDSEHNLFRSFVSDRWQDSATMFYAISSMAAAKVSRGLPSMKKQALQYQSQAIIHLYADLSRASCWNEELLFVVLMLGLSASWHVVTDLGITHLKAMQQAITEPDFQQTCESRILQFVKEALVYWEMVICSVDDDVVVHDNLISDAPEPTPSSHHDGQNAGSPSKASLIMPHPWTGVAAAPQALSARVVHRIRQARSCRRDESIMESIIDHPDEFLGVLNELEAQIWHLRLPSLHEIANTGDKNTPAIHHLLLAEAYMFATMYQLYYIFPNMRRWQITLLRDMSLGELSLKYSWAYDQARLWPSLLQSPFSHDQLLKFLSRNILLRLEQIQDTSGTCCVHALLLLVGSGSLSVVPELEETHEAKEVLRVRRFVLDRLSQVSASKLSEPISQVHLVILEIFRRLDLGLDVFWMEVMDAMGVVTIIG